MHGDVSCIPTFCKFHHVALFLLVSTKVPCVQSESLYNAYTMQLYTIQCQGKQVTSQILILSLIPLGQHWLTFYQTPVFSLYQHSLLRKAGKVHHKLTTGWLASADNITAAKQKPRASTCVYGHKAAPMTNPNVACSKALLSPSAASHSLASCS